MFSWKLGRVAGIDLYLHSTFVLLLVLIALTQGGLPAVVFTMAVFGCVLLHELGHALTARGFGIPTASITLYPIGGVARLERLPRAPGAELLITIAGPAVNLAIAAGLGLALWAGGLLEPWAAESVIGRFVETLMAANIMLAVFNLLPAFPMDGGRIVRALLSGWLGRARATEIAATLGQVLAVALPLVLMGFGLFNPLHLILAAFLYLAARSELAQVRAEEAHRQRNVNGGQEIWTAPPGYRWVSRGPGAWQLTPIVLTVDDRPGRPWF